MFPILKNLHPDHMRIARGAMRVVFFLILGKIIGAIKEMAVANRYGVNEVVDAYQFTMTMSSWLPVTLVGTFSIVLIPMLVKLRYDTKNQQTQFLSQLQGWMIFLGLLIAGATFLFWPWVLDTFAGQFDAIARQASQDLVYAFAPATLLTLLVGLSMARLRARERHINNLLDGLPALMIFVWIFLTPGDRTISPLLWGTLVGYLLQAGILYYLAGRADQNFIIPSLGVKSPYWSMLLAATGIMLIGQIATSFVGPLDQITAAHLGQNTNATLGYATRLLSLLIGIGAASVGRAALPVLADIQAKGDAQRARTMALKWTVMMLFGGVLVVAVMWLLCPYLVKILFERGAFTPENTIAVTEVMRYGLLQLPFYFGVLILVQLMASQSRYTLMAAIAVANFSLKALMNYLLAPVMGAEGIMLATSLMYLLSFTCYLVAVIKLDPVKSNVQTRKS